MITLDDSDDDSAVPSKEVITIGDSDSEDPSTNEGAKRQRHSGGCASTLLKQAEDLEPMRAIDLLTTALRISRDVGDQNIELKCLDHLGSAYCEVGNNRTALEFFRDSLKVMDAVEDRVGKYDHYERARVYSNIGTACARIDDLDRAQKSLREASELLDFHRNTLSTDDSRLSFGEQPLPNYVARMLQQVHIDLKQPEEAFQCAERARSYATEMLLARDRPDLRRLEFSLYVEHSRGRAVPPDPFVKRPLPAVDVAEMQSVAARHHAAIIVFSEGVDRQRMFAWIIRSSHGAGLVCRELTIPSDDSSLTQVVELTRRTLNVRSRQTRVVDREAKQKRDLACIEPPTLDEDSLEREQRSETEDSVLRRCHHLLIEPIVDALGTEISLIIVPDRDLYALPFAALRDANGKHLVEKYKLCISPSMGALIELERRTASRQPFTATNRALVVGDPDFFGWLTQLGGARQEAQEVRLQLQTAGMQVTSLIGKEATKQAVVDAMRDSGIVHLATHGSSDGVCLSGCTMADIQLTMDEVHRRVRLDRAKLVVLSECDSFRGQLHADGVIGITRAFLAAGGPTLLATLWQVDDEATRALMQLFYKSLLEGHDAATALQSAMASMIRDGYPAKQWASFVCYGLPNAVL